MEQRIVLLCLALAGAGPCLGSFSNYDYGGMPVMINRLVGEPSVLSLRGRVDANWYRVMNSESCPLECDCPIQWPSAMYCDSRGLTYAPTTLPPRTQYLFLQGNRITSLPPEGFKNSTLTRWLILDHNEMVSNQISGAVLKGLPHLQNLFINYNNLTDIPGPLPDGLKQLRLAHNKIGKISPNAFENLKNLTLLLLHGNQLKTIGEADFKEPMEQRIVLLCLALAGAGPCLGSFSNYDYGGMPVMINRLVGEPSVLSLRGRVDANWYRVMNSESCPLECDCPIQWPSAMYCDSRGLTYAPTTLPPRTQYLFLQGNRITSLPPEGFKNSTLTRWLILDHNEMVSNQISGAVLKGLPHLQNLFINYNNLTDIPGPLPDGLKQLRLAHNKIGKMSLQWGLQSIILLDLSHNKLIEFPKNLPPSIQQLYVSNNSLASLPQDCLMGFDRLQYLRISHNKLVNQGLPADVFNVPSIVELDLSYNQLSSIPPVHQALQYLYLEANHIQEFNVTSFCRKVSPVDFSHMRILCLDGNQLSYHQLPLDWGLCLRVLRDIYI
ncbi:UNVERIFIED_CONTAM: hypothetical protein FKN15_045075 [Acipenser sinensis]